MIGKAYAEYAESDVEWIGTVPRHWTTKPLWSMFLREKDVDHPEEPMLSVYRDHGVIFKNSRDDNLNQTAENRSIYQLIGPGWLICNRMKAWQGSVGVSAIRGIVSGHYICFRPQHREDHRYLNWLFRSDVYTHGYRTISRGVRPGQAEIDNDDYRVLPVLLPPADEQRVIADYLDAEVAKIDALIAKQGQLIETLRERRAGLIARSTTGEIDPLHIPSAPPVPFMPLGYGFYVTLGKMLDAGKDVRGGDELLPYIRAANIQDDGLRLEDVNTMPYSAAEAKSLDLRRGDLLVVEGGAVGTNVVLNESLPGWSFQKTVNRLRPFRDWSPRFFGYVLRTYRDTGVIDVICNKSTIPHLTAEKLRALRVPVPAPEKQRRITGYLDEQTTKIDALIAKTERFIELARERRAALITAAVTGQIDVREGAA